MKVLPSVLLLLPVLFPLSCYGWTGREWLGVVEAVAGTVVLRPPSLPSSDTCENCGGTGELGDGVVSVECPVCEGTGKPVQPGKYQSTQQDCPSCHSPVKINSNLIPPGKDAPAAKQDAVSSGGSTYNPRLFRRRRQ